MGKKHARAAKPLHDERRAEHDDEQADDYDDLGGSLLAASFLGAWMGWVTLHEVMGWSWPGGSSTPGVAERIAAGLLSLYAFLACVAAFFSRAAQVCELWSEQCAETAMQSRGRLVTWPPVLMARGMSLISAATASFAEVLASLYGWRSFGGQVSRRAQIARINAAANAKTAGDALHKARKGP
ncbi:hypothetical protein [Streptomyces nigrescens]|uniref:hypothetical protein n=1 Tax=Streptomyces nigrescens TaxID=1920 RepID=UPI0036FB36A8